MNRRGRVAFVLAAIAIAAAAQFVAAPPSRSERSGAAHESVLTSVTHRQDSAVVPANALVRSGRAIGELLSVPLADLLAFVALLALWFTRSIRRQERLAHAVVRYRRRGPPAHLPVD